MTDTADDRRWELLRWAIVVVVACVHVAFLLLDQRLPSDVGRQFPAVPWLAERLGTPSAWPEIALHAATMTGWYELLQAIGVRVMGTELRLLDAGWLVLQLAAAGAVARRLGGSIAGAAATGVLATNAMLVQQARLGSMHVAEAALLTAALACWAADRDLERGRTRLGLAVLGALIGSLRATGLIWLAPLALAIGATAPRRRVAPVAAAWALGALPSLFALAWYAGGKIARRELYAALVPEFAHELLAWGPSFLGLAALGLALAARMPRERVVAVLGAWIALGFGLKLTFHTGLVDFVPMIAAIAIIAGRGLATSRLLAVAPAVVAVVALAPSLMPGMGMLDAERPFDRLAADDVRGVLDATCAPGRRCRVAVDQGVFRPYAEDESLEMLLLARPKVELVLLRNVRHGARRIKVDALVEIVCDADREADWARRWPENAAARRDVTAANGLAVAWERDVGTGCTWRWSTPGGTLRAPDRLPQR